MIDSNARSLPRTINPGKRKLSILYPRRTIRHTNNQVNNQNSNHCPQRNVESSANMGEVLRERKSFVPSHAPCETRACKIGPNDDKEVQADHDQSAEYPSAVDRMSDVHPPVHVRLRGYEKSGAEHGRNDQYLGVRHTCHVRFPVASCPHHEKCCKPARDAAENHCPHHHTLVTDDEPKNYVIRDCKTYWGLLGRILHLFDLPPDIGSA